MNYRVKEGAMMVLYIEWKYNPIYLGYSQIMPVVSA